MYGWLGVMTVILVCFIAILWEIFILPSCHRLIYFQPDLRRLGTLSFLTCSPGPAVLDLWLVCLLLILSSQLLISTSCSTLPPSSPNHLQSSCPKNRACFRFRPQLSWRRKTLKLSTLNPLSFSNSTLAPWSCITWCLKKLEVKKNWASGKTQISVNVLKIFLSLSWESWRKLFSGFASLSRI